jgi:hypothetical protein
MVMSASFLKKLNIWAAAKAAPFQNSAAYQNRGAIRKRGAFRLSVIVILAFMALGVTRSVAQGRPQLKRPEDIPQEKPPEAKKPKKVKGPRAVGLLQINSKGKATLIPIAILVDGKFYDAGVYKADPVPMALDSGTIYEVEQTGDSQGLFTVSGALHSRSTGSANPWVGAGSFLPNGSEEAKKTRTAEDVPKGMDNGDSDAPPRLTRGNAPKAASNPSSNPSSGAANAGASTGAKSSAKASGTEPGGSSQPANGSSSTASGSGSTAQEKPAAAASDKPANGSAEQSPATPQATASQTGAGQTSAGRTSQTQSSPSQSSQSQSPEGQSSQSQSAQSQAGESYYRPTLRRGKPTQAAPEDDDEPTATGKPGQPAAAAAASAGPVRLVPAISDSGGPDPRAYKFFWKTGEEDEQREHMLALATEEVRAYAAALAKNRIPANPPVAKARPAKRKSSDKPAQPVFENVQFHAFDLWLNNQPVTILSAEAHLPPEAGATAPAEAYTYNVTVAARTDIYGNLRKLYSGVTDKFHLDVTPRLQLIDAVDADGDGRGELLFRETTDAGNGYIIYRATADKLWKMFDSLGE